MRRLSFTVFAAVLGSLLLFAAAVIGIGYWSWESRTEQFERQVATVLADASLKDPRRTPVQLQSTLEGWHAQTQFDFAIIDATGRLLARAGRPIARAGMPGMPGTPGMPGMRY
jgi:hypothetical protein